MTETKLLLSTLRKCLILCALCMTTFFSAMANAILAPFFPHEAEKRGATGIQYGFVFGIFSLVVVISSPIYGKYLFKLGMRKTLFGGFTLAGISLVTFGFLGMINDGDLFIVMSCFVRILQALGAAAASTACFSITATIFPDSMSTFLATVEIFTGVGYIVGPTVGGYLYEIGGFSLPYNVIGPLMLLSGVFVHFVLKEFEGSKKKSSKVGIISILRILPVFLDMCSVTAAAMCFGFIGATLEPHLRQFHLSPSSTGLVFMCLGSSYILTAPWVGRLCDKIIDPRKAITFGNLVIAAGFMLDGPLSFIPVDTKLWLTCVGLCLQGLGFSCIYVPAFTASIRTAIAFGLPDDITTLGVVMGLVVAFFSLGTFTGPILGGYLFDTFGFRKGSISMVALNLLLFIIRCCVVCIPRCSSQTALIARSYNGNDCESDTQALISSKDVDETPDILAEDSYGSTRKSSNDTSSVNEGGTSEQDKGGTKSRDEESDNFNKVIEASTEEYNDDTKAIKDGNI